jgi:class 3 adenylate cyclase/predicted ATPase
MDFRILGPLEVTENGRTLELGAAKQQALLAVLLLRPNEVVSAARLQDELWGEAPPVSAAKLVQGYVSGLRKRLGEDTIVTRAAGYELRVEPDRVDAARFEQLAAEGRASLGNDPDRASERLRQALSLWRGSALDGLEFESSARNEVARLDEQRLAVLEHRIEADLALGRHTELVAELRELAAKHPYRERLRGHLMLALYRSGRQAEALAVYRDASRLLADELGLEPSEQLKQLERQMLAHASELDLPEPTVVAPPPAPRAEPRPLQGRRLVTVVFADIAGSTALGERLDPEALHALLDRYSELCAAILERHGATIEKFVGDAAVGVFGLATLHEDDALRAVRAAVELREAVAVLGAELEQRHGTGLAVKLGINSGEVFVDVGRRREPFASGDAMNVAARLQQLASGGQILLGESTYRLVQGFVRAEALEPLVLRGRAAETRAWRLLDVSTEEQYAAGPTSLFVGRARELSELQAVLTRAQADSTCELVTVVGVPGVGKSRLARELLDTAEDELTAVVGRCLSYGQGITYRPVAEIVRQLAGADPERSVPELLEAEDEGGAIARLVLGAIGLSDESARAEEIFWAVRKLLETVARRRRLVAVFEDVHWAEPTLLDLLEYVAAFSSGSPIVLLCLARPEFLETRPSWAAPQPNRSMLVLDPLSSTDSTELVGALDFASLDEEASARVVELAEGNPLFLEQLVAVHAEGEAAPESLPPSIQAVLAARIEGLEPGQRAVLERAAVVGRSFHRGTVAELLPEPERRDLSDHLLALVRRQLIRADRPELVGEDAFRFTHALVRDAAYEGMSKRVRADLHERLAGWLDTRPGVQDEIVGYHLEQACRHRADLAMAGELERALASTASMRLGAAARAALMRGDLPAGAGLLERAVSLLPQDDSARSALLPALGVALFEAGRLADADRVLAEAIERAGAEGDPQLEARASVEQQLVRLHAESDTIEHARELADSALDVLERGEDELDQCRAWRLKAWIAWTESLAGDADEAWRRAAELARRAGDERELHEILGWRASAAVFGPTPVPEAIHRCMDIRAQVRGGPVAAAVTLRPLGLLHAMTGDFDTARRLLGEGNRILDDLGRMQSSVSHYDALVEILAGRPAAAAERLREGYENLERMGERALLATTAALLAQAVYGLGRYEEAGKLCAVSKDAAAREDVATQAMWRGVRARLLTREGRVDEAERLALEAVQLTESTDLLNVRADALLDLADVRRVRGRSAEGDAAARQALELYEQKGNVVSAARARSWLAATPAGGD